MATSLKIIAISVILSVASCGQKGPLEAPAARQHHAEDSHEAGYRAQPGLF